ncbi:kinase-like domain-containing protein [Lentinula raphanica]|nr:kinase-like domain-containing protein [Lentinula raphanica]
MAPSGTPYYSYPGQQPHPIPISDPDSKPSNSDSPLSSSISQSPLVHSFFTDPPNTWPSDLSDKLLQSTSLSASPTSYVDLYDNKYVLKTNTLPSAILDTPRLAHEIHIMALAGPECALPIVGRHFLHGKINGFVTEYKKCVLDRRLIGELGPGHTHTNGVRIDIDPGVYKNRKEMIFKFVALLERLHSKGILHGDVNPSNLVLVDSDSESESVSSSFTSSSSTPTPDLRFIDFAESVLESSPRPLHHPKNRVLTARYNSPTALNDTFAPLTRADDLYTAGMTMLHMYTGRLPFADLWEGEDMDEVEVEERIMGGLRPDLSVIDDEEVREVIARYLQAGEPNRQATSL